MTIDSQMLLDQGGKAAQQGTHAVYASDQFRMYAYKVRVA
jgi:hypothetical protein